MHTPFMDRGTHAHSQSRGSSAGGRLKQRLAMILTRSTCTTNTTSAANSGSGTTAFVSLAKASAADSVTSHHHHHQEAPPSPYFCTPCTYEGPSKAHGGGRPRRRRRSRSRSASLVHISVDCTGGAGAACGRRSAHSDAPLLQLQRRSVPARDVKRQSGRSRVKKSASRRRHHCSSSSASSWGRARRPRSTPAPYSWSTSASASYTATDDELAPSSGSDGEAETRTLFSSLSLSSDSTSEFYHANARGGGNTNTTRTRRSTRHRNTTARRHAPRRALPIARTSDPPDAFRPLVSVETSKHSRECSNERKKEEKGAVTSAKKQTMGAAEDETGAGMAVVKRSSNPYLDFRSSMVEMVVERRIGSVGQMEGLLGSYLSLNSPRHHPAILAAFEDVWEAVFGDE